MLNATQSYKQAQVNTVGRADITLMLYDGLLRFLDLAAEKWSKSKFRIKAITFHGLLTSSMNWIPPSIWKRAVKYQRVA